MTTPEAEALVNAANGEKPAIADPGTGGSRVAATQDWLRGRTDSGLGRLVLLWFQRHFDGIAPSATASDGAAPFAFLIFFFSTK